MGIAVSTSFKPRYRRTVELAQRYGVTSLLDVGCRDCILHRALQSQPVTQSIRYTGIDIEQNAQGTVDYVGDITQGLPFEAGAYDMVVALDVLEHLDDLHIGLTEIDRLAGRYVLVALPNMAHVFFRVRFLVKGSLSGKYNLRYGYGADRHRWLTVLPQTNAYLERFCAERGYRLTRLDLSHEGRYLPLLERVLRMLRFPPSWYVWTPLYVIDKTGA